MTELLSSMASSNLKKLTNEMRFIEDRSDKLLDSEKYNVVKIFSVNDLIAFDPEKTDCETWESIGKYTEEFINNKTASYAYYTPRYIYLLLNGGVSHSELVSRFAASAAIYFNSKKIRTSLIEFQSDTEFLTYFSFKNHKSFLYSLQRCGNFTKTVMTRQTIKELEKSLDSESLDKWNSLSLEQKYGVHLKQSDSFFGKIDSRENRFKHFLL